eukprot:11532907-Ditylum_brightwellii.AAC.1
MKSGWELYYMYMRGIGGLDTWAVSRKVGAYMWYPVLPVHYACTGLARQLKLPEGHPRPGWRCISPEREYVA